MKLYIIILSILLTSCSFDKKEETDQESEYSQETDIEKTKGWNYKTVNKQQINTLMDDICSTVDLEFVDLYPILDSIASDKNEKLILVESLKNKGFQAINWGRGNWQYGPRIVSISMSNGQCNCQIDKLYYSTNTNEEYKVTERIKCNKIDNGQIIPIIDTAKPLNNNVELNDLPYFLSKVNTAYVKSHSKNRSLTFATTGGDTISDEFLKKHIFNLPLSDKKLDKIPYDEYGEFYFHEYFDFLNHLYFSIMYKDESCCEAVYGITINKETKLIVSANLIGLEGGDGGWTEEDFGTWESDSVLNIIAAELYEDSNDKLFIDTTWRKITIRSSGQISREVVDSVHIEKLVKN